MAKDVKCSVESCKYQCEGKCEAKSIQVDNCHCDSACDTDQTSCDTFELR